MKHHRKGPWVWTIFIMSLLSAFVLVHNSAKVHQASTPDRASARLGSSDLRQTGRPQIVETYGKLPLSFEINRGQTGPQVKFLSRGSGYSLFLTADEAVLALRRSGVRSQKSVTPPFWPGHQGSGDFLARPLAPPTSFLPTTKKLKDLAPRASARMPKPESRSLAALRMKVVGANPQAKTTALDAQSNIVQPTQKMPNTRWRKLSPLQLLHQLRRRVPLNSDAGSIFLQARSYSSGGDALAVTVADVNGDRKPDLLVANECASSSICANGTVGVLLGNGDGTFQAAVTYGSGGYEADSVAVADVNGDGKPDLVIANSCATVPGESGCVTGGSVGVLLGKGDGTFQAAVPYGSGGQGSFSVAVADVNGDGKPDLLVANECASSSNCANGTVGVLLGNGDGTFQAAVTYGSGGEAYSVAAADVNSDGKLDLVVANGQSGSIGVLLGNGDGTFQKAATYSSGGQGSYSVAVGDVNGDGKLDLVVANEFACTGCRDGSAGVLLGNGDGTFQPVKTYRSLGWATDSVAVADVNGDGKPDLVLANLSAAGGLNYGTVSVLLGNGDGTFHAAQTYASGGLTLSVAIGDVNADGHLDVLVANGNAGVLLGNGDGTLQAGRNYTLPSSPLFAVADVNGDGKPDLIAAYCNDSNCTGYAGVLLGNGDGTFQPAQTFSLGSTYPASIAVADVNGDGKPDLLVVSQCASGVHRCVEVWLGNGDGTFNLVYIDSSDPSATSIAVADVNGDGKPDLVIANAGGWVGVLLGNGDGTFQAAVNYSSGHLSDSVVVADVNGDGKPDLVVANECADINCDMNGTVGVLLGNGDGTFQPVVTYDSGGFQAVSVAVADVNGDGKPDLLVANECAIGNNCEAGGSVGVLLGNGDGTFQTVVSTSIPVAPAAITVDDFNGDGKPDVATASGFLLRGKGDGTFESPLSLSSEGGAIAVGDFNRDAKPDLALGDITVLLNISAGFRPAATLSPTSLTFPDQTILTTSKARPVQLTNTGLGILLITDVCVTGPFSQTNTCRSSLDPRGSCTISVAFTPTIKGTATGYLAITDNAPGSPQKVPLAGTGTFIQLSPTSLNFGNQPVGTKSRPEKITVSNKGDGAVSIASLSITGTDLKDFTQTNSCGKRLASGARCFITVTFKPITTGKRTAAVSVSDNGGGSPQKVSLAGTGTP